VGQQRRIWFWARALISVGIGENKSLLEHLISSFISSVACNIMEKRAKRGYVFVPLKLSTNAKFGRVWGRVAPPVSSPLRRKKKLQEAANGASMEGVKGGAIEAKVSQKMRMTV
jgi:hypothetical protein